MLLFSIIFSIFWLDQHIIFIKITHADMKYLNVQSLEQNICVNYQKNTICINVHQIWKKKYYQLFWKLFWSFIFVRNSFRDKSRIKCDKNKKCQIEIIIMWENPRVCFIVLQNLVEIRSLRLLTVSMKLEIAVEAIMTGRFLSFHGFRRFCPSDYAHRVVHLQYRLTYTRMPDRNS